MKKCLICSHESDGETCPKCGEASWAEVKPAKKPEVVAVVGDALESEPAEVEQPQRPRGRRGRRAN